MSTELAVLMLYPNRGAAAFALENAVVEFGIEPTLEKVHFLGQCAHESTGFRNLRELGSRKYLSKYDTGRLAKALGNTPEEDGDGILYCGRGYIMTTGRDNYLRTSRALYGDDRLLEYPQMLEEPEHAARSAAWFWTANKIGTYAMRDDTLAVSRAVNLGNPHSSATPWGMSERIELTEKFRTAFEEMQVK